MPTNCLLAVVALLSSHFSLATGESVLGLILDPPEPVEVLWSGEDRHNSITKQTESADAISKIAHAAASIAQPVIPFISPKVVSKIAGRLTERADEVLEKIESAEFVTPLGLPCNPNEKQLCSRRTSSTSTSTKAPDFREWVRAKKEEKAKYNQEQYKTMRGSRMPLISDYEQPSYPTNQYKEILTLAKEVFERQKDVSKKMEAEYKHRKFLEEVQKRRYQMKNDLEEDADGALVKELKDDTLLSYETLKGFKNEFLNADQSNSRLKENELDMQFNIMGSPHLRGWFRESETSIPFLTQIENNKKIALARRKLADAIPFKNETQITESNSIDMLNDKDLLATKLNAIDNPETNYLVISANDWLLPSWLAYPLNAVFGNIANIFNRSEGVQEVVDEDGGDPYFDDSIMNAAESLVIPLDDVKSSGRLSVTPSGPFQMIPTSPFDFFTSLWESFWPEKKEEDTEFFSQNAKFNNLDNYENTVNSTLTELLENSLAALSVDSKMEKYVNKLIRREVLE